MEIIIANTDQDLSEFKESKSLEQIILQNYLTKLKVVFTEFDGSNFEETFSKILKLNSEDADIETSSSKRNINGSIVTKFTIFLYIKGKKNGPALGDHYSYLKVKEQAFLKLQSMVRAIEKESKDESK